MLDRCASTLYLLREIFYQAKACATGRELVELRWRSRAMEAPTHDPHQKPKPRPAHRSGRDLEREGQVREVCQLRVPVVIH